MTHNVGKADRLFRIVLGIVLLAAPTVTGMALFNSTLVIVLSVIVGLVMIGTASMKFCPLYRVLGMNTCKV